MLFNFFKKRVESEENDVSASITYCIKKGQTSPILNIELNDYDELSASSLCKLLDTLGSDSCYIETVEMIKNVLIQDHQETLLIKILTHISSNSKNKLINAYDEKRGSEPCIKPSDMLK
jgi:hypothetical protein